MTKIEFLNSVPFYINSDQFKEIYKYVPDPNAKGAMSLGHIQGGFLNRNRLIANVPSMSTEGFNFFQFILTDKAEGFIKFADLTASSNG